MGPDRLSRNVGKKIHFMLRKIPKERIAHLHRDGDLMSCICVCVCVFFVMKISVLGEVKSQAKEIMDHIL